MDAHSPSTVAHSEEGSEFSADVESPLLPDTTTLETRQSCSFLLPPCIWNSCTMCGLIGAALLSSGAIIVKALSDRISVFQVGVVRSLLAIPVMLPLGYYQSGMILGPMDNLKWIFFRGFFATCGFMFGVVSVVFLPISESALLVNTYPAVHAFLLWLLGISEIDGWSWVGIIGAVVSQAVIARPPFLSGEPVEWDADRILGWTCATVSSLSMALGFLIVGKIDKRIPTMIIANQTILQSLVTSMPFLVAGCPKPVVWEVSLWDACMYVGMALGTLNQIFVIRSLQLGPPLKASIVSLSRILFMVVAGLLFFSEEITLTLAIGGSSLVCFIVLVMYRKQRG